MSDLKVIMDSQLHLVGKMKLPRKSYSNGGLWIMSELRTNKIYPRDGLPAGANWWYCTNR